MDIARVVSVADARRAARRRLPRVVFDYIDGAAQDEITMRANEAAFAGLTWRPRMCAEPGRPALATTVLGTEISFPVILAPCGLASLMHPDGVIAAAQAGRARGTVTVVSTVAGTPLEEVAERAPGPKWFQLYCPGGREDAGALIDRARKAGYDAIVVTVDTNVLGLRERDLHHGLSQPLRITPRVAAHLGPQFLGRPRYLYAFARKVLATRASRTAPAPVESAPGESAPGAKASGLIPDMKASPFTWSDLAWMRERWAGPLVVKGLLTGPDARRAVEAGADAVVVSNHGGRQLDGAPATLAVLPEVVDAIGDDAEVLVDGGIRRGGDVLKARALGARAVLIGRPYLYGLAIGGRAGVERILQILKFEMGHTMTLLGCDDLATLDRTWLQDLPAPR